MTTTPPCPISDRVTPPTVQGLRLLIVGASGSSHIGASFFRAAQKLGGSVRLVDTSLAWRHGKLLQKVFWHFFDRRPLRLKGFGERVVQVCEEFRPNLLLTTGMSPLSAAVLRACGGLGVCRANFSTDDPFGKSGGASWFLKSLREYDLILNPRHANMDDFRSHGCSWVQYLPFGYDAELFFPPSEPVAKEMESDLFFAGAADAGRVPYIAAAAAAGFRLRLHGINWDRYPSTRGLSQGQADIPLLRTAIKACKVALIVVRHENRDGHAMRSFEVPAVGAALVVEDTADHRQIFGAEGDAVQYFANPGQMVAATQRLLADPELRTRLAAIAHARIVSGKNTYADRLRSLIDLSFPQ